MQRLSTFFACCLLALAGACRSVAPDPLQRTIPEASAASPAPAPARAGIADAVLAGPQMQMQTRMPRPQNYFDLMFGGTLWNGLHDLDPTGVSPVPGRYARYNSWGFAFDIGYDRVIAGDEHKAWTLGLENGWSTFQNHGSGLTSSYSDLTASMFYLAPAVRLMVDVTPQITITPGIGAGYYAFNISESQTYYYGWWWGYDSRTLNQDSAFGGFGSVAVDYHVTPTSAIRFENKVHFVHFGGLSSLYPNETSVDGPLWTIELGFVMGF